MTVRPFVDTSILVCAHDEDEPHKREMAQAWLDDHADELVVSSQVLAEFYVTVTRKLARPMQPAAAAEQLDELANATVVVVDGELVQSPARLSQTHRDVAAGCDDRPRRSSRGL